MAHSQDLVEVVPHISAMLQNFRHCNFGARCREQQFDDAREVFALCTTQQPEEEIAWVSWAQVRNGVSSV